MPEPNYDGKKVEEYSDISGMGAGDVSQNEMYKNLKPVPDTVFKDKIRKSNM